MQQSISDKLSPVITKVLRTIQDVNVKNLGSETQVLRITTTQSNMLGDTEEFVDATLIENVIIKRPFGTNVQMFASFNSTTDQTETHSIDLMEILPIEIRIPFKGEFGEVPVALKDKDILVEVLRDEWNNKIPFIMQVTKLFGAFHVKQMSGKHYEACLYRGELPDLIQSKINEYLEGLE